MVQVQRKLFKTKLCLLYQRGNCHRETCSFAHGDAELRRFSAAFNEWIYAGRREYRGSDLRDKLGRRRSPLRRYSPVRDARDRRASHGYSPSRSFRKRSDRKYRKEQHLDGESDLSGSLNASDGVEEDHVKDGKLTPSDSKDVYNEKLRQLQSEIAMLDEHKRDLEIYLEERVQEVDGLTSKVEDLEMQLHREQEECKRITSKIKRFVKSHNHHLQIQDELKRAHARLQKLGNQLGSDFGLGSNEEDSSVNVLSDGETAGIRVISSQNELQKEISLGKKRLRSHLADDELKNGNTMKGEGFKLGTNGLDKRPRQNAHLSQPEAEGGGKDGHGSPVNMDKAKRGNTNTAAADKVKGFESGLVLPSTCMAAHAVDEVVEVVETASTDAGNSVAFPMMGLPLPQPPPLPVHYKPYSQYEGDDETVDVGGPADEETIDVDIV